MNHLEGYDSFDEINKSPLPKAEQLKGLSMPCNSIQSFVPVDLLLRMIKATHGVMGRVLKQDKTHQL